MSPDSSEQPAAVTGTSNEIAQRDAKLAVDIVGAIRRGEHGAEGGPGLRRAWMAVAATTNNSELRQRICVKYKVQYPAFELKDLLRDAGLKPADVGLTHGAIKRAAKADDRRRQAARQSGNRSGNASSRHKRQRARDQQGSTPSAVRRSASSPRVRSKDKPAPVHGGPPRKGPKAGPKKKGPGHNRNGGRRT